MAKKKGKQSAENNQDMQNQHMKGTTSQVQNDNKAQNKKGSTSQSQSEYTD